MQAAASRCLDSFVPVLQAVILPTSASDHSSLDGRPLPDGAERAHERRLRKGSCTNHLSTTNERIVLAPESDYGKESWSLLDMCFRCHSLWSATLIAPVSPACIKGASLSNSSAV
mmetsp:Transcript_39988/g.127194  ORF Transcript_39988/g.127194 Transcript_39988/m.127194 type:complete len:115 (+) Transcript_39988:117-461(+)